MPLDDLLNALEGVEGGLRSVAVVEKFANLWWESDVNVAQLEGMGGLPVHDSSPFLPDDLRDRASTSYLLKQLKRCCHSTSSRGCF